jgi:uncharacterized membrane protein YqjE
MDVGETTSGPAGSLLRSVIRLAGSLLEAAETRVDLFATELREDGERGLRILAWALAALLTAILGALMAGVTLIVVFWDTHRVAAAVGVTAAFLVAAVACAAALRRRLRDKPRLLDATRSELQKDVAAIRSHQ